MSPSSSKPISLKERLRGRPKKAWRGASIEARLNYLENDMVALHPAIIRPLNEIKRLYQHCLMTRNGRAIRIICSTTLRLSVSWTPAANSASGEPRGDMR
mgnify:CR=1 FL=1